VFGRRITPLSQETNDRGKPCIPERKAKRKHLQVVPGMASTRDIIGLHITRQSAVSRPALRERARKSEHIRRASPTEVPVYWLARVALVLVDLGRAFDRDLRVRHGVHDGAACVVDM